MEAVEDMNTAGLSSDGRLLLVEERAAEQLDERLASFRERLDACLSAWPDSMASAFRDHAARYWGRPRFSCRPEHHWLHLPFWLVEKYTGADPSATAFVDHVLWGQHCLFLFCRIQDDLYDGHAGDRALIFVADQFLLESQTTFDGPLEMGCRFRCAFRECVRTATRAIVEVDALQRSPTGMTSEKLECYARVSEVFKVGAWAVSLKYGLEDLMPQVSVFADELAIVSQIFDDLEDIEEDLERGCRNYAASVFLAADRGRPVSDPARIARAMIFEGASESFMEEARQRLERARSAVESISLTAAAAYVDRALRNIEGLGASLHQIRVELLLGEFAGRPGPIHSRA